jgi:competence protein ComGC
VLQWSIAKSAAMLWESSVTRLATIVLMLLVVVVVVMLLLLVDHNRHMCDD